MSHRDEHVRPPLRGQVNHLPGYARPWNVSLVVLELRARGATRLQSSALAQE